MTVKNKIEWFIKQNNRLYALGLRFIHVRDKFCTKRIKGYSNKIEEKGLVSGLRYDIAGDNNSIVLDRESKVLHVKMFIRGNNNRVHINSGCIYKGGSIWFEGDDCFLHIDKDTTIESAAFLITENNRTIRVGEDCLLSTNIVLRTGDSHSIIDVDTRERINPAKDIVIKNHVWIGANVTILKGSVIGTQSVIGANSVVTGEVHDFSIAVGVPVKIVRNGITWLRERI